MNWVEEIRKWTTDFDRTQEMVSLSQLLCGNGKGWTWPDKWVPYFGGDPDKDVLGNPDWKNNVVTEPYTLYFISTGKWITFSDLGTGWMASFDPAYQGETKITKWKKGLHGLEEPPAVKVDIRSVVAYAVDRHKDDAAVPTKKWKYL